MLAFVASMPGFAEEAVERHQQRWQLNMPVGVTDLSSEIFNLHMIVFWLCVALGVVVFGAMFISMLLHRKSLGVKAAQFHDHTGVEIVWSIIPTIILILLFIPSYATLAKMYNTEDAEVEILVTGFQWKWKYEYLGEDVSFFSSLRTPKEEIYNEAPKGERYLLDVDRPLVIPANKKVRFLITANDVLHAWWVPDFAVKQDAVPGFVNEAWVKVKKEGFYYGQCTELCGKDHGYMPIGVRVVSANQYDRWLVERKQEAAKQRELALQQFTLEQLMERGKAVYLQHCSSCHLPNGSGVPGAFPALTKGSASTGPLERHMEMVLNGVPGTAMQAFGSQLSELELGAVITYERNAWGNDMGDLIQAIDVSDYLKASR